MTPPEREVADRILGARLMAVGEQGEGKLVFDFQHRGTDDNCGWFVIHFEDVHFHEPR